MGDDIRLDVRPEDLAATARHLVDAAGCVLADLFAADERGIDGTFVLRYVFADRDQGRLTTLRLPVDPAAPAFPSIAATVHAASLYEREIRDLFGLEPVGHPDPKRLLHHAGWPRDLHPMRKDFARDRRPPRADEPIRFRKVEGEGVFEVPVGPVHAGIIEPGHFRFSVAGEPVIHLEAQLGYVHRGIEKLAEGETPERVFYLSERISGDETFANSLAYCMAVERIAGVAVPARAETGRVVFAELERLTSHLGDLAGVCMDVAFSFAGYQFRMMRGWAYLIADELCGQRFLRSVNAIGGLRRDFLDGKAGSVSAQLRRIRTELADTADILHENSLYIDRVENTGVLSRVVAEDLHATGPGGRASGVRYDVRRAFPYAAYDRLDFQVPEHNNGDVNCRVNCKLEECRESIDLCLGALEHMPSGDVRVPIGPLPPGRSAFGLVEAPRGETLHWVRTSADGRIDRYRIRTASFCNWPALCHAVEGNILPDFPLINKSFNLSYAGNDR